ncbi:tRNA-guanine(15) transglycosylase-like protein [Massariosphaeria phaeospora]|uniref:Queuine tRNA-ribosyltransferase accessory subunit 2 n=1 Tax=Massariosphaeria phaeospora TaxID=100035 RepID=A0A7C8M9J7_9PLEO|nr:tRNA-guanine(15) transglycosylase-like protein [Massariosphaeria phaeospora]
MTQPARLDQLPPEMLDFALLKTTGTLAARLGRLSLPGRSNILTPAFLGNTSRGVLPHISPDNFRKLVELEGVYMALEDFVEKHPQKTPPILQFDVPDPLRRFVALPKDTLVVLGARRQPPIATPMSNTNAEVTLSTSVGFRSISSEYYTAAVRKLQPDIVVGLADIPYGQESIGLKRKDKMSDRTESWLRDLIAKRASIEQGDPRFSIFAPILPIDRDLQSWYLEHLVDDMVDQISGVAIYDAYLLDDLPDELHALPRLSCHMPASPQELLRQISLGMDLFTIPFISSATDAGISLDFTFPAPQSAESDSTPRRSLGVDMWLAEHAVAVTPLTEGCACYACTQHHRAYIQHLLSAKEMLGWLLLQLHNHAVLSSFFAGVRASIAAGTFDADVAAFEAFYEPALPAKTGQGPRVRGYQFQSADHGHAARKNPKAFRSLDELAKLKAMHGQQPNRKPQMQDVIDDEALVGLVQMEGVDPAVQLESLKVEDADGDDKA